MHCVLILVSFLLLIIPSATPLNFDFPSFSTQDTNTIFTEGDAYLDPESLRLTKTADGDRYWNVGRATYKKPFLLRNKATGELADFNTSFSFSINSQNNTNYGDGLAFFIAPNGSSLNVRLGTGSSLGLPFNSSTATCEYPFVAVEFDIYRNTVAAIEDPSERVFSAIDDHVGIDVNSLKSRVTAPWNGGILTGDRNTVTVRYDSSTNNLSVGFTNFLSVHSISYKVDLNKYLPDRVIVGFSASTGDFIAMHKIISWNFTSSLDESLKDSIPPISAVAAPATSPVASPTPESTTTVDLAPAPDAKPRSKNNIKLKVGMGVGGGIILVVGLAVLVLFIFGVKSEKWGSEEMSIYNTSSDVLNWKVDPNIPAPSVETSIYITSSDELLMTGDSAEVQFERETGLRQYSYGDLALATSNFSDGKKLGNGGFGDVYRGFVKSSNSEVAVKKIWKDSDSGPKEYGAEIGILSSLRHPNLVQLLGWCHEGEALLVYEFMPYGSLDSHLFGGGSLLSWEIRYRIAQDLASVLKHIQQKWNKYVVHRDIKSSNIMLDLKFNPKLGDFGLAGFVDYDDKSSKTTIVAGSVDYMAPKYVPKIKASKDTDIFSFGVVALEIACGRKPFDQCRLGSDKCNNVVGWIWELYKGEKIIEAADPKLGGIFNKSQMECSLIVGLWCSHPDKSKRPGIEQVIDLFNKDPFQDPNIPAPSVEKSIYITSSDEY